MGGVDRPQGLSKAILSEYRQLLTTYAPRPIRTAEEYELALAQLDELMALRPGPAQSLLIELFATLIESWESRGHTPTRSSRDEIRP